YDPCGHLRGTGSIRSDPDPDLVRATSVPPDVYRQKRAGSLRFADRDRDLRSYRAAGDLQYRGGHGPAPDHRHYAPVHQLRGDCDPVPDGGDGDRAGDFQEDPPGG